MIRGIMGKTDPAMEFNRGQEEYDQYRDECKMRLQIFQQVSMQLLANLGKEPLNEVTFIKSCAQTARAIWAGAKAFGEQG